MSYDNIVDVADLDCVYLSYDEPQKEEFWVRIKNMVPWARRVDGVKGSDAAHKAAAQASDTERFILIDGDNMPDMGFFNLTLDFTDKPEEYQHAQYRWRAVNAINGLRYGNGGMSSWTKEYVMNMRTHENSDGNDLHTVDFCLDYNNSLYWSMYDCYSTTYPNYTPFQAWRAGFREGVKMCLNQGRKPSLEDFKDSVHQRNLDHLTIWHNIGRDVENGIWSMLGAREGCYKTNCTDWDYANVRDFDYLTKYWDDVYKDASPEKFTEQINFYGKELREKFKLNIANFDPASSIFFKDVYNNTPRIIRKNV